MVGDRFLFLLIGMLFLTSCRQHLPDDRGNSVFIRLAAEPGRLHPLLSLTAPAKQVEMHLFLPLLQFDSKSLELRPALAKSLPEIRSIEEGPFRGGVTYTFEIHPAAKWDNGQAILATDYVFTIKALLNPNVPAAPYRAYLNFLEDIKIDPNNPRRFTILTNRPYILAEAALANIEVYPAYHYDPDSLMNAYTISQLTDSTWLASQADQELQLKDFALSFADNSLAKNEQKVVGAGAYRLKEWIPGQSIHLEKKADWWGNELVYLESGPAALHFQIIPDLNAAIGLLKAAQLDAMSGIPPDLFLQLKGDAAFARSFQLHSPQKLSYYYVGLNGNTSKLADRRVRRALAHLLDVDQLIETVLYGLAERVNGPIHPVKPYYNQALPAIAFDLEKARALLLESGWKDTDGDGILDRQVDGVKTDLSLEFKYSSNNKIAANVGLLLKENARKVGVEIQPRPVAFNLLVKEYRRRDYEMVYLAWIRPPGLDDLRQSWHSSGNIPGGSNRTGFGNAASDQIIDKIRTNFDVQERKELYISIQEMIYEEQPYIFLYTPLECMAIHRRFDAMPSVKYPGFFPNEFVQSVLTSPQ
ncbi:MAG: ABC transporter substrate-binding protein [Bacteroidota bacterium]